MIKVKFPACLNTQTHQREYSTKKFLFLTSFQNAINQSRLVIDLEKRGCEGVIYLSRDRIISNTVGTNCLDPPEPLNVLIHQKGPERHYPSLIRPESQTHFTAGDACRKVKFWHLLTLTVPLKIINHYSMARLKSSYIIYWV